MTVYPTKLDGLFDEVTLEGARDDGAVIIRVHRTIDEKTVVIRVESCCPDDHPAKVFSIETID